MLRTVYMAHPIDGANGANGGPFEQEDATIGEILHEAAVNAGAIVYDPGAAFTVARATGAGGEIQKINDLIMRECQGVLALLPPGVPTIGTILEIERARIAGMPVLVVGGTGWALADLHGVERIDWGFEAGARVADWVARTEPQNLPKIGLPFTVGEGGALPVRAHADDAGLDLFASQTRTIGPSEFVDIPCSVAVEIPSSGWGLLTGRSSTLRKRGLLVSQGVIDPGYRGALYAGVWNLTSEPVTVVAGERISQLILLPNLTSLFEPVRVAELGDSERGVSGFGSSGA